MTSAKTENRRAPTGALQSWQYMLGTGGLVILLSGINQAGTIQNERPYSRPHKLLRK